jgi:lipopolysaccharide biosynthesis regulator YciM
MSKNGKKRDAVKDFRKILDEELRKKKRRCWLCGGKGYMVWGSQCPACKGEG